MVPVVGIRPVLRQERGSVAYPPSSPPTTASTISITSVCSPFSRSCRFLFFFLCFTTKTVAARGDPGVFCNRHRQRRFLPRPAPLLGEHLRAHRGARRVRRDRSRALPHQGVACICIYLDVDVVYWIGFRGKPLSVVGVFFFFFKRGTYFGRSVRVQVFMSNFMQPSKLLQASAVACAAVVEGG